MGDLWFSQEEVKNLLLDVGIKHKQARIGSAIALCESAVLDAPVPTADFGAIGDQDKANDYWGYSYGGFQIRSQRAQKGTGGPRDEDRLLDPHFNARSAKIIHRAWGDWGAWSTYTSGMFKAYLQDLFPPEPGSYIVLAGDTLSDIANRMGGFTWQELADANGIDTPYTIHIGDTLYLPVFLP